MIRIDLLPDYVAKRRLTIQLMFVFGILFVAITCSLLAYNFVILAPQVASREALATDDESKQSALTALKTQATTTLSEIQPIQDKLQFVIDAANYNRSWVALYDQLARYTDPKLVYASAGVTGSAMAISAYTPNIEEVGRYLERMYQEPDFTVVTIDHLPGYPESVINKYYLNGKLIAVGELPGLNDQRPGVANGQGRGGQSQYPGQNGAQNSPYGGNQQNRPNGQPGQNGQNDNGLPTYGSVIDPLTAQEIPNATLDGFIDEAVSPLATGDQVTRLRNVVRERLLREVVVKHQIRGFQISVTATLKKPFLAPPVPGLGGGTVSTGATGAFGGPMGGSPMGGMPGGPGGMPGAPGGMPGAPGGRP